MVSPLIADARRIQIQGSAVCISGIIRNEMDLVHDLIPHIRKCLAENRKRCPVPVPSVCHQAAQYFASYPSGNVSIYPPQHHKQSDNPNDKAIGFYVIFAC